jgi:hypothetical protein
MIPRYVSDHASQALASRKSRHLKDPSAGGTDDVDVKYHVVPNGLEEDHVLALWASDVRTGVRDSAEDGEVGLGLKELRSEAISDSMRHTGSVVAAIRLNYRFPCKAPLQDAERRISPGGLRDGLRRQLPDFWLGVVLSESNSTALTVLGFPKPQMEEALSRAQVSCRDVEAPPGRGVVHR